MNDIYKKIFKEISFFISRIYVKILSLLRATHSIRLPEPKPRSIKRTNRISFVLLLIMVSLSFYSYIHFIEPPENFPVNKLVTIQKGASLKDLTKQLQKDSVIKNAKALEYLIRLKNASSQIHAGDYLFKKPQNIFKLANRIINGDFGLEPVKILVKEGQSAQDIANTLEKKMLRFNKNKFIKLATKKEGYLFPDTYLFMPNATEEKIIEVMNDNFKNKISKIKDLIDNFGKPLNQIITMASIVEKEAFNAKDRRLIAGVLWRRLRIGMPLQVDATFVYTHKKGSFDITMKELLDKSNLYNTYAHKGLPPAPIGNPGLSSIKATVTPIDRGNLFYLADKTGITHYSKTYSEHMKKRNLYITKQLNEKE